MLLTFGNYNSSLTFFFFVIVVALVSMGLLLAKYEEKLEYDVMSLENRERAIYLGLVVAGLSSLAFAANLLWVGGAILLAGLLATAFGHYWFRRHPLR